MSLKSILKPDSSVTIGVAEAAAIYVIYQTALPNHADIRTAAPHNADIESARKMAAWKSVALIGLIWLMTQDNNSAIIAGAALGGIDLMAKHANAVNPATGKARPGAGAAVSTPGDNATAFPMPDYGGGDDNAGAGY
jgi:hypothetical protein